MTEANRPSLILLRQRRNEILDKIVSLESQIEKLRRQVGDFDATERTWIALWGDTEDASESNVSQGPTLTAETGARKPAGTPPTSEMIIEAITEAVKEGKPGLDPAAMLVFVQRKYWPDATSTDVGSTAWRMWKRGKLSKVDDDAAIYSLRRQETAQPKQEEGDVPDQANPF